jgi:hypothetical protein
VASGRIPETALQAFGSADDALVRANMGVAFVLTKCGRLRSW